MVTSDYKTCHELPGSGGDMASMTPESSAPGADTAELLAKAHQTVAWYQNAVRPMLQKYAAERVNDLERDITRINRAIELLGEERAVCFLGNSGVGKSTLINAVVAGKERILPAGGIGPLTARDTKVGYSTDRFFEATYLGADRVHRLIFALERNYEAEQRRAGKPLARGAADDIAPLLTPEDREEVEAAIPKNEDDHEASERIRSYLRLACLLIKGDVGGDYDITYLLDCMRLAIGQQPRWHTNFHPVDQVRIERVRSCLVLAKGSGKYRKAYSADPRSFRQELEQHASGFLAPLIKTLNVGWDAPILRNGLVLVDLPGLGVANDEYHDVTVRWVRELARGIALVVDHRGIREAEASLLQNSDFLGRLLHSMDDPHADPVDLIIVIVRVDEVADTERQKARENDPESIKPWVYYLAEAQRAAKLKIISQLRVELRKTMSRNNIEEILSRLEATLEVHAVSAPQLVKFLTRDPDDPARIGHLQESGIPALQDTLARIAERRQKAIELSLSESADNLRERVRTTIELIRAGWEDDKRTDQEVDRLRDELTQFLDPLRRSLHARQGAFREFLRNGVPLEIDALVAQASNAAAGEIQNYLQGLGEAHWSTLRAAVRRGGSFDGARNIRLPTEFSRCFENAIAPVWSKKILASIRKRTGELAQDYINFIDQVAQWAEQQSARVQPKVLNALREQMKADTKELASVGKENVDELREAVKNRLLASIEASIRRRCQTFVEQHQDQGTGTKYRILGFFNDLVPEVVNIARQKSSEVLNENYKLVVAELNRVFDNYPDPLKTAEGVIVTSHATRLRRSDAASRKAVLDQLTGILAADPFRKHPEPAEVSIAHA